MSTRFKNKFSPTTKQYYSSLSTSTGNDSDSGTSEEESAAQNHHGNDGNHVCLICAENIKIVSLSSCNHPICHLCSFRNIALYKKNQCLLCRTESPKFVFTENLEAQKFDDIKKADLLPSFKNDHGIRFTSDYAKDETMRLLEYRCPVKSCSMAGIRMNNFKELNNHVKDVHNKFYCELCAKFKKAFVSELPLMGRKQLYTHQTKGDNAGFNGHPDCKFCPNKRFYSEDELNVHLRDSHEKCHVCQQLEPNDPQYFKNYDHLFQHFKSAHYTCNVQSCLDQKFVVFADEFELQTHLATEHSALYGNNILFSGNSSSFTVPRKKFSKKEEINTNNNELKKKRLEERAKHYLNYSNDLFEKFVKANTKYSNQEITVSQLVNEYHDIFKDSKDVDFSLLFYELSGMYPKNSNLSKDLEAIYKPEMEKKDFTEKFPLLPGSERALDTSSWGQSNISKSRSKLKINSAGSNVDMPALPTIGTPTFGNSSNNGNSNKSSKTVLKTRGISNNIPINGYSIPGYNPISNMTPKAPKPVWGSVSNNGSSSSLASSLSGSSSPISAKKNSAFPALPTVVTKKSVPVKVGTRVDEKLFPSLPSEQPKKVIPRVNPISNSKGSWDQSSFVTNDTTDSFDMNDLGASLKAVKKGKKGKKIVYQLSLN